MVVAPPIATFADGKASAKNLLEGLTLSIELDEARRQALAMLRAMIGSPTMVVASGGLWVDADTGELQTSCTSTSACGAHADAAGA